MLTMPIEERTESILADALAGKPTGRDDCEYLFGLSEHSADTRQLLAIADFLSRRKFGNEAIVLGQIGIETAPCPGKCDFCAFSRGQGSAPPESLSPGEIQAKAREFSASGDLFALFLMAMHEWDFSMLERAVIACREVVPKSTRLVVNVGDFDLDRALRLKALGVGGAYHVLRLREGVDSRLDPQDRLRTLEAIQRAGMDFYYCLEPIGPEHSPAELVEQLFVGVDRKSFQHAAMRRIAVPGSKLEGRGQITNLRLAQATAVVTLATLHLPETTNIAVHEPNLLGLVSGANAIYAETGANPRDTEKDTAQGRGLDVASSKRMLLDAGFEWLRLGYGTRKRIAG